MIDWVTAEIPFLHEPLNSGRIFKLDANGCVEWASPCALSVSGSWDHKIQVKSTGGDGKGRATHLYVSGNPSKFLQGHNVFGSDDLISLMMDTFQELVHLLEFHPTQPEMDAVRAGQFTLSRIDINYSYDLPSRSDVLAWIRAAEFTSKTRRGRPVSKAGTLYWGKSSRRWSLKAYSKGEEINAPKHTLPNTLIDTPIAQWADNKLRIELTLRSKELIEAGLNYAMQWSRNTALITYSRYLERLQMTEQ